MTKITLNNGIRICNFSSPHSFRFNTGEELPACDPERSQELMLVQEETEMHNPKGWTDIYMTFKMSYTVKAELVKLSHDPEIDIILVPFPVMEAAKNMTSNDLAPELAEKIFAKIRVCRTADRVTKTIYSNRFCI